MAASVRPAGGEGGNHRRRNDDAQLPLHNDDDRRSGARVADGIDAGGAEAPPTLPLVRPLDRRQAANVVLAASADHLSSTNIAVAVTRLPLKPFSGFFPAFAEAASSAAKIAARTNPLLRAKVVSVPVMDGRLSPTAHSPVYRLFFADMDDTHAVTKGKLKANPEPQQQIPPFFRTLESQLDLVIGHELSAPFQLAHGPPARGVIITPPRSPTST
ncbi:hypothetical protein DFJ73DRAFT_332290 [Zopfochytrium polystomum]|nr:hypothetical protein DFJ73DRAFT_332290 [Zopfochytrium polystomum]